MLLYSFFFLTKHLLMCLIHLELIFIHHVTGRSTFFPYGYI